MIYHNYFVILDCKSDAYAILARNCRNCIAQDSSVIKRNNGRLGDARLLNPYKPLRRDLHGCMRILAFF